jgi:hypothetical protein
VQRTKLTRPATAAGVAANAANAANAAAAALAVEVGNANAIVLARGPPGAQVAQLPHGGHGTVQGPGNAPLATGELVTRLPTLPPDLAAAHAAEEEGVVVYGRVALCVGPEFRDHQAVLSDSVPEALKVP